MSEESIYTDAVPEYKAKSRFPILSRYRDLIVFVKSAFSDNQITDIELRQIETIEKDILLEYQVAADVFFKMEQSMPHYAAARRLLDHLHRCNVFMRFAYEQAKAKHDFDSISTPQRQKEAEIISMKTVGKKVIEISAGAAGYHLLKDLENPTQRIEADLPLIRRNLSKLSPEQRAEIEAKINALIEQLKDRQLEQLSVYELNRLIGLENYLNDEKQRVRES